MAPPMRPGPGGQRPGLRRAVSVFSIPEFKFLFFSQLASMLGMQMMMIGRGILAWDLTGSFTVVGVLSLAMGIPMLTLSLIGGAVADRVDKRTLIMVTQAVTATMALLNGVLIAAGLINIPILFATGLVEGTMFAFMMPSRQALLRDFIPDHQLMNAMAISSAAASSTTILGPALAGGIIALFGVQAAYFCLALTGLASFVLFSFLPSAPARPVAGGMARPSVLGDVRAGVGYVYRTPALRLLMLMAFIPALFAMPQQMLLPGYADEVLGDEDIFPVLATVGGVGSFTGSLAIATLTDFRRKPLLQLCFGAAIALGMFIMGIGGSTIGIPAALVASLIIGATMLGYQTINNTLIMTTAEPQMMGRVMSIMMMTFSAIPLMSLPLGVLADVIGAPALFVLLGLGILVSLGAMALTNPAYLFGKMPEPSFTRDPVAAWPAPPAAQPEAASGGQ